jgi:hypothetical protein
MDRYKEFQGKPTARKPREMAAGRKAHSNAERQAQWRAKHKANTAKLKPKRAIKKKRGSRR